HHTWKRHLTRPQGALSTGACFTGGAVKDIMKLTILSSFHQYAHRSPSHDRSARVPRAFLAHRAIARHPPRARGSGGFRRLLRATAPHNFRGSDLVANRNRHRNKRGGNAQRSGHSPPRSPSSQAKGAESTAPVVEPMAAGSSSLATDLAPRNEP